MGANRLRSVERYLDLIRSSEAEAAEFAGEITARDARFFSGEDFEQLRSEIWPSLLSAGKPRIRIWAPDCGNGAHLYSIMLSALEHRPDTHGLRAIGTDASESTLRAARSGIYSDADVARLRLGCLRRWFRERAGSWQVTLEIRSRVTFTRHQLGPDAAPEPVDLIALREGLQCYDSTLRACLIEQLPRALNPGGYLWIAGAEPGLAIPGCERAGPDSPFFYARSASAPRSRSRRVAPAAPPRLLVQTAPEHLRSMLEALPLAAVILDRAMRVRFFTLGAADLFSLTRNDIGRALADLRPRLNPDRMAEVLTTAAGTGAPAQFEADTPAGHAFRVSVWPHEAGGFLVIATGKADAGGAAAENLVRNLVNPLPLALALLDEHCRIRCASAKFYALLECSEGDSAPAVLEAAESAEAAGQLLRFAADPATPDTGAGLPLAPGRAGMGLRCVRTPAGLLLYADDFAAASLERSRLERSLELANEELRTLTACVFRAQEEERRKVARELHDDLAQRLAMLEVSADQLQQAAASAPSAQAKALADLRRSAADISGELRRIAHQLHPSALDDLGLPVALKALAAEFSSLRSIAVSFRATGAIHVVPQDVATALYRIAQEALRNIGRHAGPTHGRMVLSPSRGMLELMVRDYGRGFAADPGKPGGMGLLSMQERARAVGGSFSLETKPGKGVTIRAKVPLEAEGKHG